MIRAEIKKFKEDWIGTSLPVKIFAVLGIYLTVSNIATLSNTVFAWKGFFLDGFSFYVSFRDYVFSNFPFIDLSIASPLEKNLLIFECIASAVLIKFLILGYKADYLIGSIGEYVTLAIVCPLFLGMTIRYIINDPVDRSYGVIVIFICFALTMPFATTFRQYFRNKRRDLQVIFRSYSMVIFSVLLVMILGAINAGLSR
ncbi:MAG: hypothetical protein ACI8RW_000146 [Porticoccaceae bacterium]|jgi:hypothetical protein